MISEAMNLFIVNKIIKFPCTKYSLAGIKEKLYLMLVNLKRVTE